MQPVITARHGEIPDHIYERAEEIIDKFRQVEERLGKVTITFDQATEHLKKGKAVCSVHGGEPVIAEAEGEHWGQVVERLKSKVRRALKKQRREHRDHQGPSPGPQAAPWMEEDREDELARPLPAEGEETWEEPFLREGEAG